MSRLTIKTTRKLLFKRDGNRCAYCNTVLSHKTATIDHLVPVSRGGKHSALSNMVLACSTCNQAKSDQDLFEYLKSRKVIYLKPFIKSKGGTAMKEKEKESKLEKFEPKNMILFCEGLEEDSWALRAFGVLLESSNLIEFSEDSGTDDAWQYRRGLRNIVELYLDRQERKLNEIQIKSLESPEAMIKAAEVMCEATGQGCWRTHDAALETTRKEIKRMNLVISEFGVEEYPKAKKVLDSLLDLQDGIQSRIDAQKVAKIAEEADYRRAKAERQRAAQNQTVTTENGPQKNSN